MNTKQTETKTKIPESTLIQDPYLTKADVALLVRKTVRTVEAWMRAGILPYIKIGSGKRATVLFKRADIEAHLSAKFGVGVAS